MPRYDAKRIEQKWQAYWEQHSTFVTPNEPPAGSQGKLYVLDMFPYPSGAGLHVGHPEGYTATDIVCRAARMRGKHVLHPMGWDAFGLPAEQHAINTGTHPRVTTYANIDNFRRQLKMLGFSYDWSRELSTTDEDYYRWTQWIFLQLFDTWFDPAMEWTGPDGTLRIGKGRPIAELPIPNEVLASGETERPGDALNSHVVRAYQDAHRLAYQSEAPVNWCPALGTVLANEEVTAEGKSDRGNHPVERRPLRQWLLRITAYAERLISELEQVDWPESVKILQRNWIGRSTGAEVDFLVEGARGQGPGASDGASNLVSGERFANSSTLNSQISTSFDSWKLTRANTGFPATPESNVIRVYTTRPDTLYGATYMVLAPEHPLVDSITTPEQKSAVEEYRRKASLKSDLDRTDLAKEKSGVFTGANAINPVTGKPVPIWIADYVLASYGTGAIMAVPAHDERDWEFAKQFDLPIVPVVADSTLNPQPSTLNAPYTEPGTAINSGPYDGLSTPEFKDKITHDLHKQGLGKQAVNFRLRDWLFSRQRYWGEPFPIWHELDAAGNLTGRIRPVPFEELPVTLPDMEDFKPKGTPEPPLSAAPAAWLYKTDSDGVKLRRETNSMPQWAGSCWYYLRFADNKNGHAFIDSKVEDYWLPVDLYIGGAEHAVLHLLYSRFWHKVLFDRGHVSTPEPFTKLVNQGMILGEAELTGWKKESSVQSPVSSAGNESQFSRRPTGDADPLNAQPSTLSDFVSAKFVKDETDTRTGEKVVAVKLSPEQVEKRGNDLVLKDQPEIVVESRAEKMSKARGNVVNPDDVVAAYGADSLRLYEMFMGPLEQVKPWTTTGVEGVYRFLGRAWRMVTDADADEVKLHASVQDVAPTPDQERLLHKTIKAVTEDIDKLSFNTAISRMMEFVNAFTGSDVRPKSCLESFTLLLSPFAPHLAEEMWEVLGHTGSLAYHPWPHFDDSKLVESEVEIPVQVNGKVRGKIKAPTGADQAALQRLAEADATVQTQLAGKQVVKVICVPGKMVNFVVKG